MAGCKPEYVRVGLAAVEAALEEQFAMHGVLATTMFVGPVVVVNGPIRRRVGMNAKGNALGQGNRANAAIGRALQLVIRNIGGGRPQEVDRATLGNPGKYTYCFAEGGPPSLAGKSVNKFRPGGLMIVRAGGDAGMFSGIIGGWSAGGPRGSLPVTKEVKS